MSIDDTKLDRFLDEALSSYSEAEPNLGFESRILARLQAEPGKPTWLTPAYAVLATLLLAVAVCGAWRIQSSDGSSIAPPPATAWRLPAPNLQNTPPSDQPTVKQARALQRRVSGRASVVHPKLPVERPLSQQEKLLLAFARENPQEILSTAEWQEHMRQPAEEQPSPDQGER